jgi:hypothetical protein
MMRSLGVFLFLVSLTATQSRAQFISGGYPVPGPLNYLPYYNQRPNVATGRPPLSPYLNLLNGNNPALNYYYGVRPLLPTTYGNLAPQPFQAPVTNPGFITSSQSSPPVERERFEPEDSKRFRLPSPGGAVTYGNNFGSSRAGVGFTRPSNAGSGNTRSGAKVPATIPRSL